MGFLKNSHCYLVGGLVAIFGMFPYIGNFIIPVDELIFFRGVQNHQPVIVIILVMTKYKYDDDSHYDTSSFIMGIDRVFGI